MFLVWVRTVLSDTISSRAMSGPLRSLREQAEHVELAGAQLVDEAGARTARPVRSRPSPASTRRADAGGTAPRPRRRAGGSPSPDPRRGRAGRSPRARPGPAPRRARASRAGRSSRASSGQGQQHEDLDGAAGPSAVLGGDEQPSSSPTACSIGERPPIGRCRCRRSAGPRASEQHPGQGDVLELADVAELVVGGETAVGRPSRGGRRRRPGPAAPGPSARRRAGPRGRSRCCRGARPRRAARARRRGRRGPAGGAPSRRASGRRAAGARRARRARCWPGGAAPRRRGRCVRGAPRSGRRACRPRPATRGASVGEPQAGLEGCGGVAEPALGELDVGQAEGAAEDVGEVVGRDEAAGRRRRSGGAPASRSPVVQCASPSSAAARALAEVVVGVGQLERSVGVRDRPVDVAGEERQRRPGTTANCAGRRANSRGRRRSAAGSRASSLASTSSRSCSTPAMSPVAIRAPTRSMASTGRSAKTLVGQGLEPAPERSPPGGSGA